MKVPSHEFEQTVHFYQVILGFERKEMHSTAENESIAFCFGDKNLSIGRSTPSKSCEQKRVNLGGGVSPCNTVAYIY